MKTFFIFGEIDQKTLEVLEAIKTFKDDMVESEELFDGRPNKSDRDIQVVICSEGGDENVGFAIFDALMAYRKFGRVTTVGYGEVCSIASLILQAGDERLLSPNCVVMIHNGSIKADRPIDERELIEMAQFFQNNNKRYYAAIAKRGGMSLDKVQKWCDDETYFTADEAIKTKLADKIVKEL